MATMMRTIVVGAAAFAIGLAWSSSASELAPGEIVSVSQDTFTIRLTEPIDVADRRAMKLASEYCAKKKQTMVVKDKTFDMGYGYTLTWSCLPPKRAPIDH